MDIQRIRLEVAQAARTFALVEAHPTTDGGVFVKAGLQTSVGNAYVAAIYFANYPSQMPKVYITRPAVQKGTGHQYNDGNIYRQAAIRFFGEFAPTQLQRKQNPATISPE